MRAAVIFACLLALTCLAGGQTKISASASPAIPLNVSSTTSVASEMGGAFMFPAKCDDSGNLYIRKFASDRPTLGAVVKIDPDGKRAAIFDPAAFSKLALDRADAFSPASDGGLYRIAQKGIAKPAIYILHFSSDGSPSAPVLLDADLEVYSFAAFPIGDFLVSGVQRDLTNAKDRGRTFTAVFSADGRMLEQLSFAAPPSPRSPSANETAALTLDVSDAEAASDGNLYVMKSSSPALVYVISPAAKILRTLKIASPLPGLTPSGLQMSANRLTLAFWSEEKQSQILVVVDAQTGRKIATYSDMTGPGSLFACYSANEAVFTFLRLGEGNTLDVIRSEAK